MVVAMTHAVGTKDALPKMVANTILGADTQDASTEMVDVTMHEAVTWAVAKMVAVTTQEDATQGVVDKAILPFA
tara:strand:+ start:1252 stop:1473 length:222 start_codon:yes stop_codon:yes gene_type:complete